VKFHVLNMRSAVQQNDQNTRIQNDKKRWINVFCNRILELVIKLPGIKLLHEKQYVLIFYDEINFATGSKRR